MRSRTTAGFVIIIAIVLAFSIKTLLTLAQIGAEQESGQLLRDVADKSAKAMQTKSWKSGIEQIAGSPDVTERNITIIVLERPERGDRDRPRQWTADQIVWKSRSQVPPLPPARPSNGQETTEQKEYFSKWKMAGANWGGRGKVVFAIRPNTGVIRDMDRRRMDMLLMGGLVVLVVGGGSWFLVGLTLSPIRKLTKQAANASAENLHVRLEPPSNDAEVVGLVDTLNGFLQRMAETAESKGRFYAAASHELRTPLQALSGHLELALSRERSAEEYRGALEEAKKQSGRLKSLVQSLLLLHQLENNPSRDKDNVDLSAVCRGVLQQLGPLMQSRDLRTSMEVPAGTTVAAISNHAEILIRNLLENAGKYATTGKQVRVAASVTENGTQFEVFNECEPILGWTSEKVFEAFFRPDSARNAKTGGNGLGLAICRAIANADGWTLRVDQVENGFLASVFFPSILVSSAADLRKKPKEKPVGGQIADTPVT